MTARIALAAAKSGRPISAHRRRLGVAAIVLAPAIMFFSHCALADEGGVSFWVPGFFGSLAATPQQPGWSLANIYYHTSVSAGADVARAREFTLNRVPANVTVNANLNLNVNATGDLGFVIPTYVFATPVLGGQASVSLMAAYGVVGTSLAGTLSGVVTGPFGNSVPFARSDTISDTTWGFGDLAPDIPIELERRRPQLHDLYHRRHPGWRLPIHAPVEYRHRTRRDRRRRRLHLFQSADRPRILRRARLHLQFQEYCDAVSERRRHALRLGCIAIPVEAGHGWPRGLCLQGASAATAVQATVSAASSPRWLASVPRSGSCFRSATCRAISISRLTASSLRKTGHQAGIPGSPSLSRRPRPERLRRQSRSSENIRINQPAGPPNRRRCSAASTK